MENSAPAAFLREDSRVALAACGEDRVSFLQGMLTNDIASLRPNEGVAALLLTEQGRITASLNVFCEEERLLLDLEAEAAARLEPGLAKFIVADDVEFESAEKVSLALYGAEAVAQLGKLVEGTLPAEEGAHALVKMAGCSVMAARLTATEPAMFRVFAASDRDATTICDALEQAGWAPLDDSAADAWRISVGLAREGVDYDGETLAPEVPSLAPAISFRKGCYLGQEVVERVAARGKVNWLVQAMSLEAPVPAGSELQSEGRVVGRLSSVAPGDGEVAAIARVRREIVEERISVEATGSSGIVRGMAVAQAASEE